MKGLIHLCCPAFRGPGGIASYARRVCEAIDPAPVQVLDPAESSVLFSAPSNVGRVTASHTRAGFAARLAATWTTSPASTFVFAHLGLTRPLVALPRRPDHRVVVLLHGIEAWLPLSRARAAGLGRVDLFVSTTAYTRDLFLAHNLGAISPEARHRVVPLSAEQRLEQRPPAPRPTDDRRHIICVTRLTTDEPLKGLPTLLAAAERLDGARYVVDLVGDGNGRASIEAQVRSRGLADRVRIHGWVSDEMRTRLIEEADVLCLPSAQEGFGIVFLEAMVAGRPSVGAAAGGIPSVLSDRTGLMFPYAEPDALAETLVEASERMRDGRWTPTSIRAEYDARYAWSHWRRAWRELLAGEPS
jgi:glycosyltransferase involved in cell wall biosynthesis